MWERCSGARRDQAENLPLETTQAEAGEKLSISDRASRRAKALLASGIQPLIDLCDQDRLAFSLAYDIVKDEGRARLGGGYVN